MVGKTFSHYEVLEPLGAGGMGEVYRARDTRLDREVAIKVLPEDFAADRDRLARLEREAKLLASLNHPNIAAIYGLEHEGDQRFIAMELLEGQTLADRLAKGALPLERALRHGIEIGKALHEAHRAGIVHRDLKPGNVMLTRQGVKLMDFGLAKATSPFAAAGDDPSSTAPTAAHPLTEIGTLIGTIPYMSPEQLEGAEIDVRADIFAFGSLLYEMITGRRAFLGASQAGVISAILTTEPPPVSASQSAAPPFLDHLVLKCLAKDPDERWQSARDLAVELEWVEGSSSPGQLRTVAPAAAVERAIAPPERSGWQLSPRSDYHIAYFKSADGTSIAAARGGRGTPLFVVPTMVDTIETSWAIHAAAFEGHELITYDRRGTGLSERGTAPDEADRYLQDAQAVVDGFGLEEFDVLGALLGSIEAAWVAAQNPERVKRLVLRAPTLGLGDWASIPGVAAALAAMEHDWEYFTESFGQFVAGWGDPNGPRLAARFRAITSQGELRALINALMKLDLIAVYDAIRAPTLVEHHPDYFFPDAYSRRVASMIRDCRMAIFSGTDGEFIADLSIAREFLRNE